MYTRYIKRILDVIFSVILMILLAIPMLIIGFVTWCCSKDSVLFKQTRSGMYKKPFVLYKFRTMPVDTNPEIPTAKFEGREGLNGWQLFLRKTSLDELPQLFNILKSDMSFIGPRPVICAETNLIEERDKYWANDVKPGLTGWAQVNGRDNLSVEEKARLDGEYVERVSFLFDCKCFFKTVITVFKNKGI